VAHVCLWHSNGRGSDTRINWPSTDNVVTGVSSRILQVVCWYVRYYRFCCICDGSSEIQIIIFSIKTPNCSFIFLLLQAVNQVYPGIVKHDSTSILTDATVDDIILFNEMTNMPIVEGKLLLGLTPNEMKIFDWFEEVNIMYKRDVVRVAVDKHWVDAEAYIWLLGDEQKTSYILDTSTKWCYKIFREKYLHTYLLQTVASCRKEIQRLKIGTPDLS